MRDSANTVFGDRPSQWEIANFDPLQNRIATPEPIATKFGTIDYVRQRTP